MSEVEKILTEWVNEVWNDYYIIYCDKFADEGGFKIVEHEMPTITHAFYRLLTVLLPEIVAGDVPYSVSQEALVFFVNGTKVTIKPFDEMIHHTRYVKGVNNGGNS